MIGSLTAALRFSKGWVREYLNLVMGIGCTMATMGIVSTRGTKGNFGTMATMGIVSTTGTKGNFGTESPRD